MPRTAPAESPAVAHIVDQLERAFGGDAWHGPSVLEALDGITAREAAARPIDAAHSIWEIALHVTSWKLEVCRRVEGAEPGIPVEGDWPEPGSPTASSWKQTRSALTAAHRRLIAATRLLRDDRLTDMVGAHRDRPLGSGVSFHDMLLGAVQHDVYHAGQIAILKKGVVA